MIRSALLAALTAALLLPACAPAPTANACGSPEQFRDAFIDRTRKMYPAATVEVKGPLDVGVKVPGQSGATEMYLDNFFVDCGRSPDQRDAMLNHLAATLGRSPEEILNAPLPTRQSRLVSVIRPAHVDEASSAGAGPMVQRPFAGEMAEYLAEKPPGLLAFVNHEHMGEFQLDETALWSRARANISTVITGVKIEALAPGLYLVSAESEDAPSLILDDAFWRGRVTAQTGQPVVFFSDRESFMYADSANAAALAGLRRMVAGDDGNAMSMKLYRRGVDSHWSEE
jgi:hypothetical protein